MAKPVRSLHSQSYTLPYQIYSSSAIKMERQALLRNLLPRDENWSGSDQEDFKQTVFHLGSELLRKCAKEIFANWGWKVKVNILTKFQGNARALVCVSVRFVHINVTVEGYAILPVCPKPEWKQSYRGFWSPFKTDQSSPSCMGVRRFCEDVILLLKDVLPEYRAFYVNTVTTGNITCLLVPHVAKLLGVPCSPNLLEAIHNNTQGFEAVTYRTSLASQRRRT